jgi:hypothetical protein
VDPQDLAVIGEQVRPRRRARWPFVAGGLAVVVLAGLVWFAVVGYDTTIHVHFVDSVPYCRMYVVVEGRMFADIHSATGGAIEDEGLPLGDRVRIHRQLLHPTSYTFLATNGQRIPLHPGGFACSGP